MTDPIVVSTLIFLVFCLFGLSWFAGTDAPFVPSDKNKIKKIFKKINLKNKIFYELGSGDGRVVLEAAKSGARSFGVEQSWLRVWYSRFTAKKQGIKEAYFFHGNIFDRAYFPADVVYIYMLSEAVARLEKKLKKELKKGSIIITQRYHFKSWKPEKTIDDFNFYKV